MGFTDKYGLVQYGETKFFTRERIMKDKRQRCEIIGCNWTSGTIYEHCHRHGWVRGLVCSGCNSRMARVDAVAYGLSRYPFTDMMYGDGPSAAETSHALITHWMRCPDCAAVAFIALAGKIKDVRNEIAAGRIAMFDLPVERPEGLCDGKGDAA